MGQTCLHLPCCPGTLFPGCSHPSLAGVARLAPILMMPILCRKQLILETALMRPLDRVASMAVLTATGVENVFKFDRTKAPALRTGQTRVYLISANLIMAKLVADQVSEAATGSNDKVIRHRYSGEYLMLYQLYKVHIILLPRNLEVIQRLFEEEGLAGYTVIHSYTWEFLPLDYDLLSLELPQVFLHSHQDLYTGQIA